MRGSIQQLEQAREHALAELARDRARANSRIDEFRALIETLEEAHRADIAMINTAHAQEKMRATNRFEALKGHLLQEIDKEARFLVELEAPFAGQPMDPHGTPSTAEPTGEGEPSSETAAGIGHNSRKARK